MSGIIVAWIRKDGQRQTGVAYHAEQSDEYHNQGKLFVRLANAPLRDKDGIMSVDQREPMNVMVSRENIEIIGFID